MKTYKALFLPEELHHIIKVQATKNKITMIELVENAIRDYEMKFMEGDKKK